jgi:hypothetical protein
MAKKAETPHTADQAFETPKWVYVGPVYDLGIQLPDNQPPVRPAEMSDAEIDAFIAAHPKYAEWWAIPAYLSEETR